MDPIVIITIIVGILAINVFIMRLQISVINKQTDSAIKNIFKVLENQNGINMVMGQKIDEILKREEENKNSNK